MHDLCMLSLTNGSLIITVKVEVAYHLCSQYSKKNRTLIEYCFRCVEQFSNIRCGFSKLLWCFEKWLKTRLAGSSNIVQPFSFCLAHVFTRSLDTTRIMREQQNSKFELYSNNNPTVQIYFQIIFEFTWYATSAFTVINNQ